MTHANRHVLPLALAILVAALSTVHAQSPAGTVASLQGRAEAQRGGTAWKTLAAGNDVFVGDHLRTGDASRMKLLMRDDSVITLGPRSELTVDEQIVRP